jgi:cytoplasmic iron level regulating protein YaaA (DUF328/UPF0246 family)
MKTIVLVSCVSRKRDKKSKARELYFGPLFENSMAYAQSLGADEIYILSALYGLLRLEDEISPYDVTMAYVPPDKRKPGLKILSKPEKKEWGERVCTALSNHANLASDKFILLAGAEYAKPLRGRLILLEEPLRGLQQGRRVARLKELLRG